jgi:serine/threonine protein kinase
MMNARAVNHPSAETLRAFSLGKLTDSLLVDTVLQHVETCADCRAKVAALSGGGSLKGLRDTRQKSDAPIPTREVSDIARAMKAAEQVATTPPQVADLPAELRDHPQFDVVRELGRGGMGVVYLARNKLMDRLEVLKVVNKALLDRPGMLERFLREIRSAAKLNHPNVVTAYNAMQAGELLVFAMEYVPGEDLAHVVKSYGGPLPVLNACYYVQQVLLGLQHAFEKSMVHRDIKPQNLILAKEDKKHVVKILDFGLAKARSEKGAEHDLTGAGKMLGTPDYIAPEQSMDAASADIRADIYSLGCTFYFLLAGHAPFKGRSLFEILQAHQSQVARPLHEERSDVPPGLTAVVAKMMAKAPQERYQTPIEVAQAILPFLKASGKGSSAGVTPARPSPTATAVAVRMDQPQRPVEALADPVRQETVGEGPATIGEARRRLAPQPPSTPAPIPAGGKRKWLLVGAGLTTALLIGLVAWWAGSGVRVVTKDGVIVLENLPADADVLVDGDKITVTWVKDGKQAEISVKPGKHQIVAKLRDGTTVVGEEVVIEEKGRVLLTARREALPPGQPGTHKPGGGGTPGDKGAPSPLVSGRPGGGGTPSDQGAPGPLVSGPPGGGSSAGTIGGGPGGAVSPAPGQEQNSFFNKRDLTGWYGLEGYWHVKDGAIVGLTEKNPGFNTFLCSKRKYKDFELSFQVRLKDGVGNSGVQIRSEIFDRAKYAVSGPQCDIGWAGGNSSWGDLYGEFFGGMMMEAPKDVATRVLRPKEFNDYYIKCVRKHVTIKLNGETTVDADFPKMPDEGIIAWQLHAGPPMEATFRNINFTDLSEVGASEGFVPLFNGKDLIGWKTHPKQPGNWRVVPGTAGDVLTGSGPAASHLYTERGDYRDFHLRVEARINDKGNSGVYCRAPFGPQFPAKNPAFPLGYEAQINSTHADVNKTGSLYVGSDGALVSIREMLVPPSKWFTLEVIAQDNRILVKVDGKTTADFPDDKRRFTSGHIALQQHDPQTIAEFRKIEIKELKATAAVEDTKPAAADPLPKGSVWKGTRSYLKGAWAGNTVTYELHIQQRDGVKFKGVKFDNGPNRNRLQIAGEIHGNILTWTESGISFRGILDKDTIRVTFKGPVGRTTTEGEGILKR